MDIEKRAYRESRVAAEDSRTLAGYPIVFNVRSEDLGGFYEVIDPAAVDRALSTGADIRALVDHDPSKILARTRAGTLQLRKQPQGLKARIETDLAISYAGDIVRSVGRGDVSGMSFAFRVLEEAWNWEEQTPVRTILDMEIREVSIVTFPAFPQTDISVALRSLEAFKQTAGGNRLAWLARWHKTKIAAGV